MLMKGGESAVKEAAATQRLVYNINVAEPECTMSVKPVLSSDGSVCVHADVTGKDFKLLVTAVYDARRATRAATRLDITDVEYTIVSNVVKARSSGGEVALFFQVSGLGLTFDILRGVLEKLSDVGVAVKSALLISKTKIFYRKPDIPCQQSANRNGSRRANRRAWIHERRCTDDTRGWGSCAQRRGGCPS